MRYKVFVDTNILRGYDYSEAGHGEDGSRTPLKRKR